MRNYLIVIGALSGLAIIVGAALDLQATLAAYLVAWIAIGAIPIGAVGILMTTYLVRRAWTEGLHTVLVATTAGLPVLAILLLPILLGMTSLYPATTDLHGLPPFKAIYLAPWFFALRSLIYFVTLWLIAVWQRVAWGSSERMGRSAAVGLIVYALLVSLAGVDWLESLEPDFHSSIFGLIYLSLVLLNGTAFAIGAGLALERPIGPTRGYSSLLLSVILLWT